MEDSKIVITYICSQNNITSILINNTLVTIFQQIAKSFNDFFIEVGSKLSQQIPAPSHFPMKYISGFLSHFSVKLSFKSVSEHDVSKLLADLPNDKANALDNIQSRLLRIASAEISNSLAYIFNKSLQLGAVSDEYKKARISAKFKKGAKTDPGKYRPISILPVVSKVFECNLQFVDLEDRNKCLSGARNLKHHYG